MYLGVNGASHLLQNLLETLHGGLTAAVDLEAGNSPEVWTAGNGIREFLYFVEMVEHADRCLHVPHGGGVSCPGGQVRLRSSSLQVRNVRTEVLANFVSLSHQPGNILTKHSPTAVTIRAESYVRVLCMSYTCW